MGDSIKLIDLNSGDMKDLDIHQLMLKGMPIGYKCIEDISPIDWANMYSKLRKWVGSIKITLGVIVDEVIKIIQNNSNFIEGLDECINDDILEIDSGKFCIDSHLWCEDILPGIEKKYGVDAKDNILMNLISVDITLGELVIKASKRILNLLKDS